MKNFSVNRYLYMLAHSMMHKNEFGFIVINAVETRQDILAKNHQKMASLLNVSFVGS